MARKIELSPRKSRRTENLTLRLTPTEKNRLAHLSRRLERSTASLARDFLFQAVTLFEQQEENGNAD